MRGAGVDMFEVTKRRFGDAVFSMFAHKQDGKYGVLVLDARGTKVISSTLRMNDIMEGYDIAMVEVSRLTYCLLSVVVAAAVASSARRLTNAGLPHRSRRAPEPPAQAPEAAQHPGHILC